MSSSASIVSQAIQALQQSSMPVLRRLQIEETPDAVIVRGVVGSFYLKQLAQETLLPVLDGKQLDNQVTVKPSFHGNRSGLESPR